jgi:stearoyl-CoA desaturase (delta-9 desaturase)
MDVLFGILQLPWWGYVVLTLVLTHITIASVTIFLHRHQAHRAIDLHPTASHFFRFWLWLTTGMVTKEWTAIHRKHHAKCETEDDPHSPQAHGLQRVLWLGVFLYVKEAHNNETLKRYGAGTPNDWIECTLYSRYPKLGIVLCFLLQIVLFGPLIGPLIWGVQMIWIPFFAAGVVNGVGHYLGYRNADTPDASHNILPWGIIIGGEELHNNHHAFPDSAKLSLRPFPVEFDIGWLYIRLLSFVGLAKVKNLPPELKDSRCFVDEETIAFLRKDKGRVRYMYRKLLLRVVENELPHAQGKVREHLLGVQQLLRNVSWKQDALPSTRLHIAALDDSESMIPSLGKFAELLMHIQATHKEVMTTPEREASLVSELDHWCKRMIADGPPRFARFARMLMKSHISKQYS